MLTTVERGKLTVTGAGKDLMVMDEKGDSVKVTIVDVMQSNGVILVVDKGIDAQLTRVNATSERVTVCIGARSIVSKRPGSSPKLPRVEAGKVPDEHSRRDSLWKNLLEAAAAQFCQTTVLGAKPDPVD